MDTVCRGPIKSRAWGLQPSLHTIRMKPKNWESLHSNFMHLCIIYPVLYATDWSSGQSGHFSLHKKRSTWANVGKPKHSLAYNYCACLKWCSKGALCLPHLLLGLFCFVFSALKTGNKLKRSRKERKNKERAINKMHIVNNGQFLRAFRLYPNAK